MVAQDKAAQAAVLGKRHPTPNLSFSNLVCPNSFEANQIGKTEEIIFCLIHKAALVPRLPRAIIFRPFGTSRLARSARILAERKTEAQPREPGSIWNNAARVSQRDQQLGGRLLPQCRVRL